MPTFEPYRNLSGNSGVIAYAILPSAIQVQFADGIYTYDHTTPGWAHVERMKLLARSGRGLASYISRHVKTRYATKSHPRP